MAASSSSDANEQCASNIGHVNFANFVTLKPYLKDEERSTTYKIWKEQMVCLVESQGLLGFIDGSERQVPDDKLWRRRDRLVKGWILGSIGEDVLGALVRGLHESTAREIWLELEKIFNQEEAPENDNSKEDQHEISAHQEYQDYQEDVGINQVQKETPENGHPHEEDGDHAKDFSWYLPLYRAALKGDWKTAEKYLLNKDKEETKAIISSRLETALSVSVGTGKANDFVKKLLELMPDEAVAQKDFYGDTALHYAARVGNKEAAIMLVNRKPDLQYITNKWDRLPVQLAAISCHKDILVYLISTSKPNVENSPLVGILGCRLLLATIASEFFDVALDLVDKYPDLARPRNDYNYSGLATIAAMDSVFPSGVSFSWWQKWIYSRIPLKWSPSRFGRTTSIAPDIENLGLDALEHSKSAKFQITYECNYDLRFCCMIIVSLLTN